MTPFSIIFISLLLIPLSACGTSTEHSTGSNPETRTEWRKLIKWDDQCEEGVKHITQYSSRFVGVDHYQLKSGVELVKVVCETGAYNRGSIIYIRTSKQSDFILLNFLQVGAAKNALPPVKSASGFYTYSDNLLWGNIHVDLKTGRITNTDFFRGGGGCGLVNEYLINNSQAELINFKAYPDCSTKNPPVENWPQYTPSQWSTWVKGNKPER